MTATTSWRDIARTLAHRLEEHAALAGAAADMDPVFDGIAYLVVGCPHRLADAQPDDCPYCADRAAYRAWQARETRAQAQTHRHQHAIT